MTLLAACSLVACGANEPKPDPVAPTVLADIAAPLDCPKAEPRVPPAELDVPLDLPAPEVLPIGDGDYGITRSAVETIIDALRMAHQRNERWRAWAGK